MNSSHNKFGGINWAASLTIAAAQTAFLKHCPPPSGFATSSAVPRRRHWSATSSTMRRRGRGC